MPQSEAPSMNELGSRGLRYALTMVPPPTTTVWDKRLVTGLLRAPRFVMRQGLNPETADPTGKLPHPGQNRPF